MIVDAFSHLKLYYYGIFCILFRWLCGERPSNAECFKRLTELGFMPNSLEDKPPHIITKSTNVDHIITVISRHDFT